SKIVRGLTDEHTFVRVVREDPKQKGLLYAGTETGLYISFNDGLNWQDFQLNLPVVPINDLTIQDNDLVAATAGRSFWVLDDLGAIQNTSVNNISLSIFKPKDTYLLFGGSSDKPVPGLGQNPKQGVTFDYYLNEDSDSLNLELQVLHNGKVIRTITNKSQKEFKSWPGGPSKPAVLPSKKGYNRFTWDFRKETLPAVDKVFVYGNYSGSLVAPGNYVLRLSLEDEVAETDVSILPNPKVKASKSDFDEQQSVLDQIENTIKNIHESVTKMRSAKKQLKTYEALLKENEIAADLLEKGKELIKRIDSWEQNLIQPNQKTFQDVINYNNQLNAQLMHLKGFVDSSDPKVTQGAKQRLADLMNVWKTFEDEKESIVNTEMATYNKMYTDLGIPALILED
ncbi:MAG: glycosyl hydrolase, partial [Eudoraea sp.]|nr:glycosyl hydrolase [Eudoraea sp.]